MDVHRLHSPEDIRALLDAQGWIVDGSDVSGEARELVAILQDTLVGRDHVNSGISATEQPHPGRDAGIRAMNSNLLALRWPLADHGLGFRPILGRKDE